jgi:hypothetical protein
MLSTGQVDLGILRAFEHQFYALDKTRDGTVTLEDFPDGMGLRKTHSKLNKTMTTFIEVVDYKSANSQPVRSVADSIKKVQHESLEARVLYEMEERKGLHAAAKEKAQQKAHHSKGHRQTSQRDADAWTAAHVPAGGASPKQHKASLVASDVAAMCVDAALERKAAPEETSSRVPAEPNSVAHEEPESSADTALGEVRQMGSALFKIHPVEREDLAPALWPPTDSTLLRLGSRLAAQFDSGAWDYGTVTDIGVAPARRGICPGSAAVDPLQAGHVSAEVAFLDGEVEWHDFDPAASAMDVSDGWVKYRFVSAEEFSQEEAAGTDCPLQPTFTLGREYQNWAEQETAAATVEASARIMV